MAKRAVTQRSPPTMLDVLDRVLDKGIVIAFDVDVSVAGLSAVRVTGHVIVASIECYRDYAERGAHDGRPALSWSANS